MLPRMATALTVLAAYCIGSVSFAIVVSRLMRLPDPRSYGSKNPGATNVLRTGKKAAAVLTLAGDAGKGWLAVWLADATRRRRSRPRAWRRSSATSIRCSTASRAARASRPRRGCCFGFSAWLGLAALGTWIVIALALPLLLARFARGRGGCSLLCLVSRLGKRAS